MNHFIKLACTSVVLLLAVSLRAEILTGKVIGITDGDTLKVLGPTNVQHVIRLKGIDAPERGQNFGRQSKENLARLAFAKQVMLECGKEESYGRLVCKVVVGRVDVCLQQIIDGLAWHYKQFEKEQSAEDRKLYADAEDAARAERIGLWAEVHPTPPWNFRHSVVTPLCFDKMNRRIGCGDRYAGPVRGNARSHIYQWPGCPFFNSISERNRIDFPDAATAEGAGYQGAKNCP